MEPVKDGNGNTLVPGDDVSVHRLVSAAGSVNATLISAGNKSLLGVIGYNAAAAARYIKFYNKATAPDENDTPVLTLPVAATSRIDIDLSKYNLDFSLGLGYRMTTAAADNSTAALTAADVVGFNVIYK
jgi:hypothetical protein